MSANNFLETFKIFNPQKNIIFKFVINSHNICETYYKEIPLFGNILYKTNNFIIIQWKHLTRPQTIEYIKDYKYNYYIKNEQSTIPLDWDPEAYRNMNLDLSRTGMTDTELFRYYLETDIIENRPFRIEFPIPDDFDPKTYRMLNSDLSNLNDYELKTHYIYYGSKENRKYCQSQISDHSTLKHGTYQPIFINHDISLTGAPIFLYDLVDYLTRNNIIFNPIIVEPYPNNLFMNYNCSFNKKYHYNDIKNFQQILDDIDPVFIYSNSINNFFLNTDLFVKYIDRTIFHFHESLENINKQCLRKISDKPILVVANKIESQLKTFGCQNTQILPPFIDKNKIHKIKNFAKTAILSNIDDTKIVIGMSGTICDRKGFLCFYETAKRHSDKEFVWVGGPQDWKKEAEKIYGMSFADLDNFYHVPQTHNPYCYYKKFDYFFLTSKNDPCPIVILENMAIGNKIIVIENNIFYDHQQYFKGDDQYITLKNISKFDKLTLSKKHKKNQNNIMSQYIMKFFNKPNTRHLVADLYLVLSYTFDDNIYKLYKFINELNILNIFYANKIRFRLYVNIPHHLKKQYIPKLNRIIGLEQILYTTNFQHIDDCRYIYINCDESNTNLFTTLAQHVHHA